MFPNLDLFLGYFYTYVFKVNLYGCFYNAVLGIDIKLHPTSAVTIR